MSDVNHVENGTSSVTKRKQKDKHRKMKDTTTTAESVHSPLLAEHEAAASILIPDSLSHPQADSLSVLSASSTELSQASPSVQQEASSPGVIVSTLSVWSRYNPRNSVVFIFIVGIFGMLVAGTIYAFSTWSPDMKSMLNYSQSDIALVGYLGNAGGYSQPIVGVMVNKYAPSVSAIVAAALTFFGYACMALAVSSVDAFSFIRNPVVMGLCHFVVQVGITVIYSVALAVNVVNLPPHRLGMGVAIMVTFFGLSATVFGTMYTYVLNGDLQSYLWFAAIFTAACCLLNAVGLKRLPYAHTDENTTTDTTAPLLTPSQAEVEVEVSTKETAVNSSPYILTDEQLTGPNPINPSEINTQSTDTLLPADHLSSSSAPPSPTSATTTSITISNAPSHIRGSNALKDINGEALNGKSLISVFIVLKHLCYDRMFYAYFFYMLFVGAGGYITLNNTGDVVQSLNNGEKDNKFTFYCILTLSLCNGTGRIISGMSDKIAVKRGWFCAVSASLMLFAYVFDLFVVREKQHLLVSVVFVGLSYGMMWSVVPTLTAECWGRDLFPICWGWVAVAPALSSLLFNLAVGKMYDAQADSNHLCVGASCWAYPFILGISAAATGLIIAIITIPHTQVGKRAVQQK